MMKIHTSIRRSVSLFALSVPLWSALGEDCSPIRLDEENGSMAHVEVRDQHQIGSCYAHAAAQMFDAWRYTHGEQNADDYKNFSSGFEIGQRFKIDENAQVEKDSRLKKNIEKDINGGFVKEILPFLLQEGTCSQKELNGLFREDVRKSEKINVDSYASIVMQTFNRYKNQFLAGRAEIHRIYHPEERETNLGLLDTGMIRAVSDHPLPTSSRLRIEILQDEMRDIEALRKEVLKKGIQDIRTLNERVLSNPDLDIHYGEIKAVENTVKLFETLSVIDCADKRRRMARGKFKVHAHDIQLAGLFSSPRSDSERSIFFRSVLDAELDKGLRRAYPIGIAYCSVLFKEGRAYRPRSYSSDSCSRHASLVIGRRRDSQNRCQYLIRNTWGKKCNAYHPDWSCEAERGAVWVDRDILSQATKELQTIEPLEE